MIRSSLLAAALFSLVALVAVSCQAEVLTQNWTDTDFEAVQFGAPDIRDWVIWGQQQISASTTDSTTAYLVKGGYGEEAPPINPTAYLIGSAAGTIYRTGGVLGPFNINPPADPEPFEFYGGLSLMGNQVAGAGFLVQANLLAGETFNVWVTSYESPFSLYTSSFSGSTSPIYKTVFSNGIYSVSTNEPTVVNVFVQQLNSSTAGEAVYIGGASIQGVAVPEPETITLAGLAGLPLLAIRRRKKV